MSFTQRSIHGALGMVLTLLWAASATAQTGGTLQGSVTDDQKLALPGATVTLTNTETGWTRSLVTDTEGRYRAPVLPPGDYEIKAELAGFATAIRNKVALTLGQELTINLAMRVASVQETVTVTGESPWSTPASNTLGTTISREQLDSLPVPGRSFTALAQTAPGVTGVGGGGVNAGGQLSRNNSYRIDGVSNDNNVLASPRGGVSMEAVREYVGHRQPVRRRIRRRLRRHRQRRHPLRHQRPARPRLPVPPRRAASTRRIPSRRRKGSGQAPFSQQRFGGFLGGPIKRDRMHYFGSYEGLRAGSDRRSSRRRLVPVDQREVPTPATGDQYFVAHRLSG